MEARCRTIPELLAPAGDFAKLETAIHYGADAVYLAGKEFSLRARAGNFSNEDLGRAVAYAHARSVKVYVTVNIFARNADLEGLPAYLSLLREAEVDGLIIADPGILNVARETFSDIPLHLSTQANVTNSASVRFWAGQGVRRINLARELGLAEIRQIRAATATELEVFVHGALCISYSGRCLLSNYFTGRDANRGDCAHPCRYAYRLVEEKRPGQYFPVEEDERGTYIFNSRDLCLLQRLPELVAAGVDSLKIEGRMKAVGYVGGVVRLYRAALDWIGEQVRAGARAADLVLPGYFSEEIVKLGTRGQSENFFTGAPGPEEMLYDRMRLAQDWVPVGIVRRTDPLVIETRNVLEKGERVEYLGRGLQTVGCTVSSMTLEDGTLLARANPGQLVRLATEPQIVAPERLAILRKKMTHAATAPGSGTPLEVLSGVDVTAPRK